MRRLPLLVLFLLSSPALANTTPGLVSLPELTEPYQGVEQGLYPGGSNAPSGAHLSYGNQKSGEIVPRAPDGTPDPNGLIGVISLGMSNTNQKWSRFERESDGNARHAARVVLIDGAQGGIDAENMANPQHRFWQEIFDARIAASGVAPEQIQVIWVMQSLRGEQGAFPARQVELKNFMQSMLDNALTRLPNVKVVYLSSRAYGGYINREPYAFETAYSVKWLIEDQVTAIDGGATEAGPWLAWGPYFWANGTCANADGTSWEPADFEDGGNNVHPALPGEIKAAALLEQFFSSDVRASAWYLPANGPELTVVDAASDALIGGDPSSPTIELTNNRAFMTFSVSAVSATAERVKLSILTHDVASVRTLAISSSDGNTPPGPDRLLFTIPTYARGGAIFADATEYVLAEIGRGASEVTFVLEGQGTFFTSESSDPPRLIFSLASGAAPPPDAGVAEDSGNAVRDSGEAPEDATSTPDSGVAPDSGSDVPQDSGIEPSPGPPSADRQTGCGCSSQSRPTGSGAPISLLMGGALLLRARRRQR